MSISERARGVDSSASSIVSLWVGSLVSGRDIRFEPRLGGGNKDVISGSGSGAGIVCIFGVGKDGEVGGGEAGASLPFWMKDDFSV